MVLRPYTEAIGAYDNRVLYTLQGGGAEGDFYAEAAAGAELRNDPARYNLALRGRYGYRFYNDYSDLDDDLYNVGVSLGTDAQPLLWDISSEYRKSIDYNIAYDPAIGQEPDSVLSDRSRKRLNTRAHIAYDSSHFNKTALVPGYTFTYYNQEYADTGTDEWQTHYADLQLRHQYSARTRIYAGGVYGFQIAEDENGSITSVIVGINQRVTERTSWLAELGYAMADYDESGTDHGVVSNVRGSWRATPKINTYVYGGNNFYPGYSGSSARMIYRLGYGVNWQLVEKFSLGGSVLHDYQTEIGDTASTDPAFDTLRNFLELRAEYDPVDRLTISTSVRHNRDQYDPAQTIVSVNVVYHID